MIIINSYKIRTDADRRFRSGAVLIVAMWIMLILASTAIVFGRFMRVEASAAKNNTTAIKCEFVVKGAINYIFYRLNTGYDNGGTTSLSNNIYEAVEVGEGYFCLLKPDLSDDRNYNYGITDEASKINLNTATLEMLMKLPSMTSELANSIIDWRDTDREVNPSGAESEYYLLLEDPYICKDADFETVEEVLLVKGASIESLFGEDINRNGVLDRNENDGSRTYPDDNADGVLDTGFYNYVTVYSYEPNVDIAGQRRINVNDMPSRAALSSLIEEVCGQRYLDIMNMIRIQSEYSSLLELYYASTMTIDEFTKIIDKITVSDEDNITGLVNINTAPAQVLLCLPSLEQSDVNAIIAKRSDSSADTENILWITEVITQEKAEAIGAFITTKSYQYSADIVATVANGKVFRRYFVVANTAGGKKQILYKQSLTSLGFPLSNDLR